MALVSGHNLKKTIVIIEMAAFEIVKVQSSMLKKKKTWNQNCLI